MALDLVTIARVGAPHGVKGHLKLQLFLESPEAIQGFSYFYFQESGQVDFKPLKDFELSQKGQQFYILFRKAQDRDLARQFTHSLLAVPRSDLPKLPENEFYWSDLEGLSVFDLHGGILGVVDHLLETGAHDVLVVKQAKHEILIPYVRPEIVKKIDLVAKKITVDWEEWG